MSGSKKRASGIRSTRNDQGLRSTLRPLGQAAVGLASVIATSNAVAQEASAPAQQQITSSPEAAGAAESNAAAAQPKPETASDGQSPATSETAPATDPYVLPTVQVVGDAEDYRVKESSLTRLPTRLVDTPQSVTVVPEDVLDDQVATSVRDALRNVSGITLSAGEGGRQGDTFILRGFSAQADMFRDGGRDLGWFTRDTFNVQGVEVFFGPSAVLFGRGSTGGAVNLVTKKPVNRNFQSITLMGGTAPSGRMELDLNHVVSEKVQVRINAMGQLADVSGRRFVEENRAGFAPSARLRLGDDTTLDLDYLFQREGGVPDYGQPFYEGEPVADRLGVARETFYGVRGEDKEEVDAHIASARLQQFFGDQVQLTNLLRFGRVDRLALPTAPRGLAPATDPTTIGRQRFETETDNLYVVNQTDVRVEFLTAFLEHTANVGLEISRETREQQRYNQNAIGLPTGPNLPADLYDPDPTPDLGVVSPVFQGSSETAVWSVGVYASDQIKLGKYIELLGSVRFDAFTTDYGARTGAGVITDVTSRDRLFNWRAGVVGHPLEKVSLYAMYGTSSNPSAELGVLANDTVSLEPERNAIYEAGAKADLLDERLNIAAAVFRIDKLNARVPNTDPEGPPQILAGAQRVDGASVGVSGTIYDRWQLLANYSLLLSRIGAHSNADMVGQELPNTPRHSLSLWTTAALTDKLTLGAGAVYQSAMAVNNPTPTSPTLNKVPAFWRFDALASYAIGENAELQLNVSNLTDALYYEQTHPAHAVPAETRSATLTGRFRF